MVLYLKISTDEDAIRAIFQFPLHREWFCIPQAMFKSVCSSYFQFPLHREWFCISRVIIVSDYGRLAFSSLFIGNGSVSGSGLSCTGHGTDFQFPLHREWFCIEGKFRIWGDGEESFSSLFIGNGSVSPVAGLVCDAKGLLSVPSS